MPIYVFMKKGQKLGGGSKKNVTNSKIFLESCEGTSKISVDGFRVS